MEEKRRIAWLDIARSFAIVAVVMCHAVEADYYFIRTGALSATSFHWYYENILFTVGRLGVPVFLMITGALMLCREYDIKSFYKRYLLPLFLTTEIWTVINYFYNCARLSSPISVKALLGNILFLKQSPLSHMWYMPMILGMYLVIPFVAKALKGVPFQNIRLPLAVGFTAFSLVPLYNAFAGNVISQLPSAQILVGVGFLGGLYGVIMVMGYYIVNEKILSRCPVWALVFVMAVSFAANTALARYFFNNKLFHTDIFGWYTSPFIIVVAICLFELLHRLRIERCNKAVSLISRGSFGIYLTHNLLLTFVNPLLKKIPAFMGANVVLQTATRFAIGFIIPLIFIWIADKLPFTRTKKLFLFMK